MEGGFLSPLRQLAVVKYSTNDGLKPWRPLPLPYHPIHGGNTAAVTWKLMDRCNRSDYKHFAIVSSI